MIDDMICLHCDNEKFVVDEAPVRQEFRGETLVVRTPVLKCTNCGWHTVGNDQIDELRRRTGDAYRKKHGLLTSEEIKAFRKLLRKTQREFAAFLGVGEASVKRWETWLVQEKGYDNLIRMKCEKALLDKLAQKSVPNVWFSYQVPLTEAACGIAVQTEPPNPLMKEHGFTTVLIAAVEGGSPKAEPSLKATIWFERVAGNANQWRLVLTLRLGSQDPAKPFAYNAELAVQGLVQASDALPQDRKEQLALVNGFSILFSAAREMLLNITARSVFGTVTLPTISFVSMVKEATRPKAPPQDPAAPVPAPAQALATDSR